MNISPVIVWFDYICFDCIQAILIMCHGVGVHCTYSTPPLLPTGHLHCTPSTQWVLPHDSLPALSGDTTDHAMVKFSPWPDQRSEPTSLSLSAGGLYKADSQSAWWESRECLGRGTGSSGEGSTLLSSLRLSLGVGEMATSSGSAPPRLRSSLQLTALPWSGWRR